MKATTRPLANPKSAVGNGFGTATNPGQARAFGGDGRTLDVQARVRFRDDHERAALTASGVPRPRATQILDCMLRLPAMQSAEPQHLRVDLHREDAGRWSHSYGLAVAVAMVSSLARRPIPPSLLFLGDVGLDGRIRDVPPQLIDRLNDAIAAFEIETPLAVVLARDSAAWVNSSSTVRVLPCRTLAEAVAAAWPDTPIEVS